MEKNGGEANMSLQMPASVPIPQAGLPQAMAEGFGKGLLENYEETLQEKLKKQQQQVKQQELIGKFKTGLPTAFNSFLKTRLSPDQLKFLDPKERQQMEKLALHYYTQTGDASGAFQTALDFNEQKNQQEQQVKEQAKEKKKELSTFKGGLLDALKGTAENRGLGSLLKKQPEALITEPAASITSITDLLASLLRSGDEPTQKIMEALEAPKREEKRKSLTELLRGDETGLTKDEVKAKRQLGNIADVALLFGPGSAEKILESSSKLFTKKIPGLLSKLRGTERVVKGAEGVVKGVEKVATKAVETVAKKEPAIAKAIKGTKAPQTAEAARTAKVLEKRKPFQAAEEIALREKQLKEFPRYSKEIETDAAKRLKKSLSIKRAETIGKEAERMALGRKEIAPLKEVYRNNIARVKALEGEMATLKGSEKTRVQSFMKYQKSELAKSEEALNNALSLSETGKLKASTTDFQKSALARLDKIKDNINEGKRVELLKRDYNPERVKEFKKLSEQKKVLPGKDIEDYHQRLKSAYENVYTKRLKELPREIASATKRKNIHELGALKKERDSITKLIDNIKADKYFHNRNLKLRQMEAAQKAKDVLKTAQPTKAPKVSSAALKQLKTSAGKYAKSPTPANLEALAKSSGIPKGSVKGLKEEVSGFGEKIKKISESKNTSKASKLKKIKGEVNSFINALKKDPANAFLKTRMGQTIAAQTLDTVLDTMGLKIPGLNFNSLGLVLGGRSPTRLLVNAVFNGLRQIAIKPLKAKVQKSQYIAALKSRDINKIRALEQKLSPKIRKEAIEEHRSK